VSAQIIHFIDQTNVRAVGVLSFVAALLALVGILGNAEMCLNDIWGRVPGRPVLRKLRALLGTAVLAPFLLLVALAFAPFLHRGTTAWVFLEQLYLGAVLLLRLVPYACSGQLHVVVHDRNRPVRLTSAVVGALIAGSCWQLAQWAYVTFVIRIVRYSAFYGALWQVPILLAWLYVAWLIILFGAEVTRAHQGRVEARSWRARQHEDGTRGVPNSIGGLPTSRCATAPRRRRQDDRSTVAGGDCPGAQGSPTSTTHSQLA
jgi:membrane protein